MEALLLGCLLAAGLWRVGRGAATRGAAVLVAGGAAVAAWQAEPLGPAVPHLPGPSPDEALVSSDACRACHPGAYATWHNSYHRTMTQAATPEAVQGDFDGVELRDRGMRLRLSREEDAYFAHILGPGGQVLRTRPIVMTTGSHHFQNYWIAEDGGWYVQLPFLWRIDAQRWLPVQDSFLHPDKPDPQQPSTWNGNCGYCHSVGHAGRMGETSDARAAELGISCEACHGPGQAHVEHHRSPWTRYLGQAAPDDPIRVPTALAPQRETAVCGQCHGIFMRTDLAGTHERADRFRPGDPLAETRQLFVPRVNPVPGGPLLIPPRGDEPSATVFQGGQGRPATVVGFAPDGLYLRQPDPRSGPVEVSIHAVGQAPPFVAPGVAVKVAADIVRVPYSDRWSANPVAHVAELMGWQGQTPTWFDLAAFWGDGTVRTTGREANAMATTGCATRGEMTCSSCHAMHGYADRADMLTPGMDGDQSCLQCHAQDVPDPAAHSHHPAGSAGARCLNCHMPHTTFGLLGGIRSHRVDSPNATRSWQTGRPNACSLCHIDRPLGWAAEHLTAWYDQPPLEALPPPWDTTSAVALWALTGDGAQRGVAAWALGWGPARSAGGSAWTAAVLAGLLDDDYAAVRSVAERALRSLPGFRDWAYDYVGPPLVREAGQKAARALAAQLTPDRRGPAVLHDAAGRPERAAIERLWGGRDRSPVHIAE